ncbi:MAG TPA: hypothetical protein ENK74_02210 [Nitratifractor sp.]|jgi:hypothetical protein|nr:hypothetical protein [Nitratifractor sp.]
MNKNILVVITLSTLFFLNGCGGDSGSSKSKQSTADIPSNIPMEMNRAYTIQKGDEIEKLSEGTEVQVVSDLNSSKTTATLLSGKAAILRAN